MKNLMITSLASTFVLRLFSTKTSSSAFVETEGLVCVSLGCNEFRGKVLLLDCSKSSHGIISWSISVTVSSQYSRQINSGDRYRIQ
jgi:hypothetical protein